MTNLRDVLPKLEDLEPSADCILWRYTDIPSLVEILTFEYLPLVRVSLFSDITEGAILKSALSKLPKATNIGKDYLLDVYKNTTFASCWCRNKEELAPMWDRFSPRDGVAIKTDAKRLLNWLTPRRGFKIKYVKYINENPDDILSELTEIDFEEFEELRQDLFFYKMSDFSDEREVRILNCRALVNFSGMVSRLNPFNLHEFKEMMDTQVIPKEIIERADIRYMNELITEIVVSPAARPGIREIVQELIKSVNALRRLEGKSPLGIRVEESRRKMWF